MATALIVANFLGPEEKGLAALSQVLPAFTAGISGLGIAASLKYTISRKDKSLKEVGLTAILLSVVQGVIAGTAFMALATTGWLGPLASGFSPWITISCATIIPILVVRQTIYMGLAGNAEFRIQNVLDFVASVLFALLSVLFVILFHFGFEGVLFSYLISSSFSALGAMIVFAAKHRPAFTIDLSFIKFSYHYGFRAWIGTLANRGNAELGQLFLGILAPASALGNYSVGVTLGRLLYLIPQSIAPVFVNQVAESKGNIEPNKIALIHRAMLLIVILSGLAIAIGVAILAPIVLPKYLDVPFLVLLFIPGAIFYSSFRILGAFFIGIGQPEKSSYCNFIALIGSLISYPILVPLFGGYGAAAASSLVYLSMYLLVVAMFNRHVRPDKTELYSFRITDVKWLKTQIVDVMRILRSSTSAEKNKSKTNS